MTLADALAQFPRERTWLLPALHALQHAERWLSPASLEAVAAHLRVPKSEVWGVASHYPEFRLAEPGRRVVRVCTGVACLARGGGEILAACERRLGVEAGETTGDQGVTLEALDCAFACGSAPVAQVDHHYRGRLTPNDVEGLLTHTTALRTQPSTGRGGPPAALPTAGSPGARFTALKREAERRRTGARLAGGLGTCGLAVGAADALGHGAYGAFARALEDGRPEQVIEEVRASGLAGRGGAYFQTAVKWAACRAAAGAPKLLVVNAEEGEPGIFKDRHLMEGDP